MANKSSNTNKGLNTRLDGHLLTYFRSTFLRGGGAINAQPGFNITTTNAASINTSGNYKYVTWTASGSFVVNSITGAATADYLLVGGGGGGAYWPGYTFGADGTPSTALGLTAYGGGGGGIYPSPGRNGGSGSGGGGFSGVGGGGLGNYVTGAKPTAAIPAPLTPQGNNGGDASTVYGGAGGGGAGAVGGNGSTNTTWSAGGVGKAAFSGDTSFPTSYGTTGPTPGRWFAAGGGSAGGTPLGASPAQPAGGGGAGSTSTAIPAVASTGSGGGGGNRAGGGGAGGGGAGGYLEGFGFSLSVGSPYPITIGTGGVPTSPISGSGANGIFVLRVPSGSTVV